jgi:nicotinamide mononucleotide transporter
MPSVNVPLDRISALIATFFPAEPKIQLEYPQWGIHVQFPQWGLDYAVSLVVIISLVYLFQKRGAYWHYSNLSTFLYFVFYLVQTPAAYMFAGLQVGYLIFGIHGMYLWMLERGRDFKGVRFNEPFWYNLGWVLTLIIFGYATYATSNTNGFADGWGALQFATTATALIANWATTRKWSWSWYLWIAVNAMYAVYFYHFEVWGQFGLQFILAAMSLEGLRQWKRDEQNTVRSSAAT